MNKKNTVMSRITAALLSALCASAAFTLNAEAVLTDADVRSYEDLIAEVSQKRAEAEEILEEIRRSQARTYEQIAQYDQILELNDEMRRLTEDQIAGLGGQIEDTRQAIEDTKTGIELQKQALLDRMRDQYMDSTTDYLEVLLDSTSLFDFLKKLDYVGAVLNYDQRLIAQMEKEQQRLTEYEELLVRTEAEQQERLGDLEDRIAEYEAAEEEKYDFVMSLEANEQWWTENYSYNKDLEDTLNRELEATLIRLEEQRRQEAEKARQEAELQRQKDEAARLYEEANTYYGDLNEHWPLEPGVKYRVSSEQGYRILWGIQDYHLGIDLACAGGTQVLAFNGGTVVKSAMHYSYGNYVLIDHGGGIATLYAHMSNRLVNEGDRVEAGQQVGNVGLTGSTTGYHLHFEVRENGKVVNPRNYLEFP